MKLGMEVGLGPGDIAFDGDPAPPKGLSSQFSSHVLCGQTAGWIKMALGTEVGLGRGIFVFYGDPALPKKGASPNFQPMYSGQTAGWIKMPLGTEVGLGPGHIVLGGDPAPLPKGACSFVRSLRAGVQPTLNPSAETVSRSNFACLVREEGNWLVCASVCA